jgi:hypothetical protein
MLARYKKMFKSSPEAAIFAIYGLVHLVVLLAAAEIEQIRALLRALGVK